MTWDRALTHTWAVSDGLIFADTLNYRETRGAVIVAYGERAKAAAGVCMDALKVVCPDLPVTVYCTPAGDLSDEQESRRAKATMLRWSPYRQTAYLDADTVPVSDISAGFAMLDDGADLVITPSDNQGDTWLWHVGEDERAETRAALGFQALQLQAGVLFVKRNRRTRLLWAAWEQEWNEHQGQDQAALLRALYQCPVKVWLLGKPWNGGAVIGHRWGAIRRAN